MPKLIKIVAIGLALTSLTVEAQSPAAPPKPPDLTLVPPEARPLYLDARPEDLTKLQNEAREFARQITGSMKTTPTEGDLAEARKTNIVRSGTAIADAAIAADRDAVLKALGISSTKQGNLYIFVSKSMPENLLRSYAKEVMWAGGQLVVRGIPANQTLGEYVREHATSLFRKKGAAVVMSIDPRLFDAYEIDVVPTIVYSEWDEERALCEVQAEVTIESTDLTYNRCGKAPSTSFWKVSGSVSLAWALAEFESQGAPGVKAFRAAMAKGPAAIDTSKDQRPYSGDWDAEPSVEEALQRKAQAEAMVGSNPGLRTYETELGTAVGPKVLTPMEPPAKPSPKK